jgi:hypothetical protein
MLTIGVDYGMNTGDLPTYVVSTRQNGKLYILDSGLISDFCYEMYADREHRIVAEFGDLERFNQQFKNN